MEIDRFVWYLKIHIIKEKGIHNMEYKLNGFQPKQALHFFEEISAIPRGSGNEAAVADYLVQFASARGLACIRDRANNVIIYEKGTHGGEDKPPVILQGHIDMVCEKVAGSTHDFIKDGIDIRIGPDGWATADGTTLGADDGAGAAAILAILDDADQPHPPIEAVFTAGEEIGFVGASQLDFSRLSARRMINLDSEDEGVACVSCAGGMEYYFDTNIVREEKAGTLFQIEICGLLGGHSGSDIDLDRVNAIKLAGRIANHMIQHRDACIVDFSGGTKDNAIPREASCTVLLPTVLAELTEDDLLALIDSIQKEYASSEPDLKITVTRIDGRVVSALTRADSLRLIGAVLLAPNGVQRRDPTQNNFVITSLNLGILRVGANHIKFTFAPRSSIDSLQDATLEALQLTADTFGFETSTAGVYPGWEYVPNSVLRDTFCESYRSLFGDELRIEGIHAGLECGLFAQNLPGLDAISVGPTLRNVHTTDEAFDLASNEKFFRLICDVLTRLAKEDL